jgi:hypothetical protein
LRVTVTDHDVCPGSDELVRQDACAATDFDNEVARSDLGSADEVGGKPLTSEEVLAGRVPCGLPPDGHGTSPSSSSLDLRASPQECHPHGDGTD